jgi:hypothetical protein
VPDGNAGPAALGVAAPGAAAPGAAALVAQLMDTIRQMNAPKRVVRDAHGRVSHVEPMPLSPMMPMPPPVSPMVPPAGVTPPVPGAQLPLGARLAPDGHHYLADPSRPGKYLRVVANG